MLFDFEVFGLFFNDFELSLSILDIRVTSLICPYVSSALLSHGLEPKKLALFSLLLYTFNCLEKKSTYEKEGASFLSAIIGVYLTN